MSDPLTLSELHRLLALARAAKQSRTWHVDGQDWPARLEAVCLYAIELRMMLDSLLSAEDYKDLAKGTRAVREAMEEAGDLYKWPAPGQGESSPAYRPGTCRQCGGTEWTLIQTEAGSGDRCRTCGRVESY